MTERPCFYSSEDMNMAYLAGLVEGEGSICIIRSRSYMPYVGIGMTDKDVIEWVHTTFGYGHIEVLKKSERATLYRLMIHRTSDVIAFLELIKPYLKTDRKRSACELLIDFCLRKLELMEKPWSERKYTKEEMKELRWYYETIKNFHTKKGTKGSGKYAKDRRW